MDDGLKINNDKRHRSSSSLAGCLDGVRSERKLDIRGSIPEVDDQFALAEARCDDLQEKIDLVKTLKRKKKLKKRSMTTIAEPVSVSGIAADNIPLITVRTQPKKKVSQQAARMRRVELPQNTNPMRGYLDPDLIEQQQMLDRVNAYNVHQPQGRVRMKANKANTENSTQPRTRLRRTRADGDTMCGQGVQIEMKNMPQEVACGDDESSDRSEQDLYSHADDIYVENKTNNSKRQTESRQQNKQVTGNRRRHVPKEPVIQIGSNIKESDGRPVVELFNKNRPTSEPWPRQLNLNINGDMKNPKARNPGHYQGENTVTGHLDEVPLKPRKQKTTLTIQTNRRAKYQSRRYELPTVSSQMKQAGLRYYYENTNQTNIPFVVSKSTAPSHNVGVNLQQVLNGLKVQQPLSGIPLTIAHHMGLRHVPTYGTRSATMQPMLHKSEINVIKLGRRILRLPSYKYMSYNRLLTLYREGDGIVPRFLRAVSRPHYFYTSMYNLTTNREDFDGATSKGRAGSQEAKQSLAEYANLYREYERVQKCLNDNYDPELEGRKEELARQLTAREDYIRKVVQEYKPGAEMEPILRASASTAEEGYRHSTFKHNTNDPN